MTKDLILKEINREVSRLSDKELGEVFDFIRFLRNREYIDPTLEILQHEDDYQNIQEGLRQKQDGRVHDWDDVK